MVEDLGLNVLVPLFVFLIVIVGAHIVTDKALEDLHRRRQSGE